MTTASGPAFLAATFALGVIASMLAPTAHAQSIPYDQDPRVVFRVEVTARSIPMLPPPPGPPCPPPPLLNWHHYDAPLLFTPIDREPVAITGTQSCQILHGGPPMPAAQGTSSESLFAACIQRVLRDMWDGLKLVANACSFVRRPITTTLAVTEELRNVWAAASEMWQADLAAMRAGASEPDVPASVLPEDVMCIRNAERVMRLPREQQFREAAAACASIVELALETVGGELLTTLRAGSQARRAGALADNLAMQARERYVQSYFQGAADRYLHAGNQNPNPRLPLISDRVIPLGPPIGRPGVEGSVYRLPVPRTDGGLVVKIPHSSQTIASAHHGDLAPRYGGFPGCTRGRVITSRNGQLVEGIVMTEIEGQTLAGSASAQRSHLTSFDEAIANQIADGRRTLDLNHHNIILGADGRTYIIDNALSLAPPAGIPTASPESLAFAEHWFETGVAAARRRIEALISGGAP